MATHVPDHALFIATQVAMMKDGHFLAVGRPDEVVTEENLRALYGIGVKIVSVAGDDPTTPVRSAVPLVRTNLLRETRQGPGVGRRTQPS
jgi:ABC-type cobalamin/Fe3+-siderophores transport system ATPase subunit